MLLLVATGEGGLVGAITGEFRSFRSDEMLPSTVLGLGGIVGAGAGDPPLRSYKSEKMLPLVDIGTGAAVGGSMTGEPLDFADGEGIRSDSSDKKAGELGGIVGAAVVGKAAAGVPVGCMPSSSGSSSTTPADIGASVFSPESSSDVSDGAAGTSAVKTNPSPGSKSDGGPSSYTTSGGGPCSRSYFCFRHAPNPIAMTESLRNQKRVRSNVRSKRSRILERSSAEKNA